MSERVQAATKKLEAKRENKVPLRQKTSPSQSISSPVEQILYLQRTIGNQAVGKLLKSGTLQAKLRLGQPGDIYEQEADRVAEQVMRMPEPMVQRKNERGKVKIDEVKGKKNQIKSITDQIRSFVQRQPEGAKEEGQAIIPNYLNFGIGTVDNKSAKTFHGNASQGKSGGSRPIMLAPGKWGDKKPIPGPAGEKLNDIDFIFPTKDTPINGKIDGAFKVGSNNATIITDPKDPKNSKIDDYDSYLPHDKAKGLTGYPVQEGAKEQQGTTIQRKCSGCTIGTKIEKEEKLLKEEAFGSTHEVNPELESSISAVRGGGQPLPESVRDSMEQRFGHDFSHVRVHTGAKAAKVASTMNAKAFTMGNNVVFGKGQFVPMTFEGRRLLAHELSHVIQQQLDHRPTTAGPVKVQAASDIVIARIPEEKKCASAGSKEKTQVPVGNARETLLLDEDAGQCRSISIFSEEFIRNYIDYNIESANYWSTAFSAQKKHYRDFWVNYKDGRQVRFNLDDIPVRYALVQRPGFIAVRTAFMPRFYVKRGGFIYPHFYGEGSTPRLIDIATTIVFNHGQREKFLEVANLTFTFAIILTTYAAFPMKTPGGLRERPSLPERSFGGSKGGGEQVPEAIPEITVPEKTGAGQFQLVGKLKQIWDKAKWFLNWLRGNQSLARIKNPLSHAEAKQVIANAQRHGLKLDLNPAGLQGMEKTGRWAGIPHFKVEDVHIPVARGFKP